MPEAKPKPIQFMGLTLKPDPVAQRSYLPAWSNRGERYPWVSVGQDVAGTWYAQCALSDRQVQLSTAKRKSRRAALGAIRRKLVGLVNDLTRLEISKDQRLSLVTFRWAHG